MPQILVEHLAKTYRVTERDPGVRGALQGLFHRRCRTIEALKQCRAWQQQGLRLSVAVNLSTRNLLDVDFPDDVAKLLDRWEVDHELLELEITESTMLADPFRTKVVLDKLSAMGVRLSIDDFGTGYSSLAYLKRLPVNEIKIDRSFVMNMNEDEDDAVIVRSTIDLGRNLGLEVVAEGVENEEIWNELSSLGCHVAQGYYLSRPVPPEELSAWVLSRRAAAGGAHGISRGPLDLLGPAEDEAAVR